MLASLPRAFGRTETSELPLGVDFQENHAWIVAGTRTTHRSGSNVTVTRAFRVDLSSEHAITNALEREGIATRRAVVSLEPSNVRTEPLKDGHVLPARFHHTSAEEHAESLIPTIGPDDSRNARLVIEGDVATLVATLQSHMDAITSRAASFGLPNPIVDAPALAWLRIVPEGIAVITPQALLAARTATGIIAAPGTHSDPAAFILQAIQRARAERAFAADVLTTNAPHSHPIYTRGAGTQFEPLRIHEHVNPPWAFAYALFTWSFA